MVALIGWLQIFIQKIVCFTKHPFLNGCLRFQVYIHRRNWQKIGYCNHCQVAGGGVYVWHRLSIPSIIISSYGSFLKWWVSPTTIGFPTKNDHFGVFGGYHYLRKHPYLLLGFQRDSWTGWYITIPLQHQNDRVEQSLETEIVAIRSTRFLCTSTMILFFQRNVHWRGPRIPKKTRMPKHGPHGILQDPLQNIHDLHCYHLMGHDDSKVSSALRVGFLILKTHMDVSPKKSWQLKSSWQKMPCALQAWSCGNVNVQIVGYSLCTSTYQNNRDTGMSVAPGKWNITPL